LIERRYTAEEIEAITLSDIAAGLRDEEIRRKLIRSEAAIWKECTAGGFLLVSCLIYGLVAATTESFWNPAPDGSDKW
jgi:hypothetical protein